MSQKAAIPFRLKKISMRFQNFHIFSNLIKNQPRYCLPKWNSFFPLIFHSQFSFENTYSPDQHFSENFCLPRFGDYLFRYQEISKDLENAIGSRLAVLKESPMSIPNVLSAFPQNANSALIVFFFTGKLNFRNLVEKECL